MRRSVAAVADLVAGIVPGEQQEAEDVRSALSWLDSTDDVFRRVKPAVPDRHLVSYVVPVRPAGCVLLGPADHRAGHAPGAAESQAGTKPRTGRCARV